MSTEQEKQKLKDFLIRELQNNTPNIAKIQELTSQLSNLDENTVGFSVDAGIIDRLGREKKTTETIKDIANKLNVIADQNEQETRKEGKEHQQSHKNDFKEYSNTLYEVAEVIQSELDETSMLRVLASLGLVIGQFTHEIKHHINSLDVSIFKIREYLQNSTEANAVAERFFSNIQSLKNYTSYYDATVAHSINRQLEPQELRDVINEFSKTVEISLNHSGITFLKPQISGFNLFTKPMHISEWSSILLNLYTNSVKAIRRANRKGQILIRAGKTKENVYLEFADNGDGIPEENKERIFEPFFTTTSPASPLSSEYDEISGTGLGLKIVKDIVTSYDGNIYLVTPPDGFATCFRIEIPKASKEEIKDDEH